VKNLWNLKFFNNTLLMVCLSLTAFADGGGNNHIQQELRNKTEGQILDLIRSHLDTMSMSADYRFQRDAAVIAIGCNTIPSVFYKQKAKCFRDHLKQIKDLTGNRSNELRFGNLVDSVCSAVQSTLTTNERHNRINPWILTYSNCMSKLVTALGEKNPLTPIFGSCERSGSMQDYVEKPNCYHEKVPRVEDSLEYLPKTNSASVQLSDMNGLFLDSVVSTTPLLPPRSALDIQKVDSLYASCTSLNTNDLPAGEKGRVAPNMDTYSIFREINCFRDGLFAIAYGATVPGTIMAACRERIPGVEVLRTKWRDINPSLKETDWNLIETRDFKTICLRNGVLNSGDKNYESIAEDSGRYLFEGAVNLFGGWIWDSSVYEDELALYNEQKLITRSEEERKSQKLISNLNELSADDLSVLAAAAKKARDIKLNNQNTQTPSEPMP
jgi:hypothetical protein